MKTILQFTGIMMCLVIVPEIYTQASPDAITSGKTDNVGFAAITDRPDSTFGDFTEITPPDPLFITPPDEDFWVIVTASGDYDNDGDIDIATLGYYVIYNTSVEERLVLMRNDGPAGPEEWDFFYTEVPLGSLTTGALDMTWGDADSEYKTVLMRNDSQGGSGGLVFSEVNSSLAPTKHAQKLLGRLRF